MKQILLQVAGYTAMMAISICKWLGENNTRKILTPLLPVYMLFRKKNTRRIHQFLNRLPVVTGMQLKNYYRIRLAVYSHMAANILNPRPPAPVKISGLPHYLHALRSGHPVMLVGIHSGAFEWMHRLPQNPHGRFGIVTGKAFSPVVSGFLNRIREIDGKECIQIAANPLKIKPFLKSKSVLAFMLDQSPSDETILLWNRLYIPCPVKLVELGIKREARIIPISCKHHICKPLELVYGSPVELCGSREQIKNQLAQLMEKMVETNPMQWNWSYPKYRLKAVN